jgi:hypothetical protein
MLASVHKGSESHPSYMQLRVARARSFLREQRNAVIAFIVMIGVLIPGIVLSYFGVVVSLGLKLGTVAVSLTTAAFFFRALARRDMLDSSPDFLYERMHRAFPALLRELRRRMGIEPPKPWPRPEPKPRA